MFPKIIIEPREGVSQEQALRAVKEVIEHGRVSEANNIAHYCWLSIFNDVAGQVRVITRKKRTTESADSFIVSRYTG